MGEMTRTYKGEEIKLSELAKMRGVTPYMMFQKVKHKPYMTGEELLAETEFRNGRRDVVLYWYQGQMIDLYEVSMKMDVKYQTLISRMRNTGDAPFSYFDGKKYLLSDLMEFDGVKMPIRAWAMVLDINPERLEKLTDKHGFFKAMKRILNCNEYTIMTSKGFRVINPSRARITSNDSRFHSNGERKKRGLEPKGDYGRFNNNVSLPVFDEDLELKNRIASYKKQGWSDSEIITKVRQSWI